LTRSKHIRPVKTPSGTPAEHGYQFPPEWTPHQATWISWPRPEGISFPGFYHRSILDVVRVIRTIAQFEQVHVNVPNANYARIVRATLREGGVPLRRVTLHEIRTNECWTRDHGPAFVQRTRRGRTQTAVVDWGFNAWGGKYPPWDADDAVPTAVARELELPVFQADIVMEGGAVDFNGAGTVLTTTSCLLNRNRNAGLSKAEIERYLKAYYGQQHVVWLGDGIAGDDTMLAPSSPLWSPILLTTITRCSPTIAAALHERETARAGRSRLSKCLCRTRWYTRACGYLQRT
jgi:agmatine deiminase